MFRLLYKAIFRLQMKLCFWHTIGKAHKIWDLFYIRICYIKMRYYLFIYLFLLTIIKNTLYKLMWRLYTVRYGTMYYYVVVGYSSCDVTSGAL